MKRFVFALCMGLGLASGACSSCEKQRPPPEPGLDKDGIQRRSDKTHNDLNREEDRDRQRKSDE